MRAALTGGGAALLYGAWLLTGYYMAWFTTLFACLLGLAAGAIWLATPGRPGLRRFAPAVIWPLPVIAVVLVLSLLPFLRVYLPKARETGMHPVAAMMAFSPSVPDLLHFGPDNYLFGWLDRAMTAAIRPGFATTGEHVIGFTPVLLLLALAGAVLAWRRTAAPWAGPVVFWRALSLAFIASLVIVVHVGSHTIWLLIYEHVPGAGAVRTVTRYVLLLLVPGCLLAMVALAAIGARSRAAAVVLGAVLVAEQFSGADPARLDRFAQLRALAALPAAPAACRSFFLRDPEAAPDMDFGRMLLANIDAMMMAELRHVPTLNGAASFHPEGDDLLFIQEPGYLSRVANTVHRYGILDGLCAFDPSRKAWMTQAFPKIDVTAGRMILLGTDAGAERPRYIGWGWADPEPGGAWTIGPAAELTLSIAPALVAAQPLELRMRTRSLVTPLAPPPRVVVFANDRQVAEWHPGSSEAIWRAELPKGLIGPDGELRLRFEIHSPRVPAEIGLGKDPRALGMHVIGFELVPAPSPPG